MNLSGIPKSRLYVLVTTERLDRRLFEMIFMGKGYEETGKLYARLRDEGTLLVEKGRYWQMSDEVKAFAQPLVEEVESIAAELTSFLRDFLDTNDPDVELKIFSTGIFWSGNNSNHYRFDITDYGNDLIVKARFSSELGAIDGETSSSQILLLKPPLKLQFDYIMETLLAHAKWAGKMSAADRKLRG